MMIPTMMMMVFKWQSEISNQAHRYFHQLDKTVEQVPKISSKVQYFSNLFSVGQVIPPKPQATRGIDLEAQGMINGQPTFEYDITNAYKDEEKPWKKPGADISDYFNYGFTEETWAQYCDRQRRLRAENNLARLNTTHVKFSWWWWIDFLIRCLDSTNATDDSRSSTDFTSDECTSADDDQ